MVKEDISQRYESAVEKMSSSQLDGSRSNEWMNKSNSDYVKVQQSAKAK